VALEGVAYDLGVIKIEGVASAAVCLLLMLSILISSPLSRLACMHYMFPSTGEVQYSALKACLERVVSCRAAPHSGFSSQTQMMCHRTQNNSRSVWFYLLVIHSPHMVMIWKAWPSLSGSPEDAGV
jgi:hypothetical protein